MNTKGASDLSHKSFAFKATAVDEAAGTFKGYASVFGNVDSYGEVVAAGAFAESLKAIKASGDPLPILWQHKWDTVIGGATELKEDEKGLYTAGELLINDLPESKRAHTLMTKRLVTGISIGYYVEDSSFDEKKGIRTLKKLDLKEYSIVTFPANGLARVDEVKSKLMAGEKPTIRAFEELLREKGFSRKDAEHIAVHGFKSWQAREGSAELSEVKSLMDGCLADLARL